VNIFDSTLSPFVNCFPSRALVIIAEQMKGERVPPCLPPGLPLLLR